MMKDKQDIDQETKVKSLSMKSMPQIKRKNGENERQEDGKNKRENASKTINYPRYEISIKIKNK